MSQVHLGQRLVKVEQSGSSESNPSSPSIIGRGGTLSPVSIAPSSPQGMPIPRRSINEAQSWLISPGGLNNNNTSYGTGVWHGMYDTGIEAMDVNISGSEFDHTRMEGELSKLSMAVDDDDIFKDERNDLLGPTLAELNAPDADTLLDGLNFDDLYWPAESLPQVEDGTPSPQTPAGGNTLDNEDLVPFQVHPSSSFPQGIGFGGGNGFKMQHFGGTSVPILGLETFTTQPVASASEFSLQSGLIKTSTSVSVSAPSTISQSTTTSTSTIGGGGLRELLLRRELQNSMDASSTDSAQLGHSLPRAMLTYSTSNVRSSSARLSTSAPTEQGNNAWESWQQRREAVWARRDPRPHLISTNSQPDAGSTSSLVSADILSPGREVSLSMDEDFDSDEQSDRESTEEESDGGGSDAESNAGSSSGNRRERYFWQYNVQAKGPKGQRLVLAPTQDDPHVLKRPTDPVFSPLCHIQGIKHSGKARKGDGNDLTPNPRKLWSIGKELDRLNKVIAEMTPVADVPSAVKSRSRKEKNKLASRACRLKKKAQHEANKLKLYGLEKEHKRLMNVLDQSRQAVFAKIDSNNADPPKSAFMKIDKLMKATAKHRVSGHSTEFVNRVLDKVKQGTADGGISEL